MDVKWIRLTTCMFDDDKIKLIESMPEKDTILIIWIKLLIQAGKTNAGGFIFLNEKIPYNEEMLSVIFGRPINSIRMALDALARFGMIERTDTSLYISNWEKHQNIKGLEEIRAQNAERVKRFRANKKLQELEYKDKEIDIDIEGNVTCNVTESVTKKIVSTRFDEFWSAYPNKKGKKKAALIYEKIIKNEEATEEKLIEGANLYALESKGKEAQYIKHPSTWLTGGCWLDESVIVPESKQKYDQWGNKLNSYGVPFAF